MIKTIKEINRFIFSKINTKYFGEKIKFHIEQGRLWFEFLFVVCNFFCLGNKYLFIKPQGALIRSNNFLCELSGFNIFSTQINTDLPDILCFRFLSPKL